LKDNKDYLTGWEQQGRQNHAKNQTDKLERERRDLRLELAMREKARRKASSDNLLAADEALSGIDGFEESLRRLQVACCCCCCWHACCWHAAGMLHARCVRAAAASTLQLAYSLLACLLLLCCCC
jgi:hypothetical protein